MAKARNSDTVWIEIDPASLSKEVKKDYDAYKEEYRLAKIAREAFEESMRATVEVPKGKKLVFGYNFGKLSVAIVDDDGRRNSAGKAAMSLSAFMASQGAAGRRV